MNPVNSPSPLNDSKKVADTAPSDSEPITAAGMKAEIVKNIPIRQQISQDSSALAAGQAPHNPILSSGYNPVAAGSAVSNNTALTQKAHPKNSKPKTTPPAAVIVVAILVVGLLIAAAIYAFKQSSESTLNF